MLAIAERRARPKVERFDRPFRDGRVFLHHFPALRTGLLSLSPFLLRPLDYGRQAGTSPIAANRYPSITSFKSSKRITRLTVISVLTRAQTGSRLESDWPKNLTDRAFTSRFISLGMRFRTTSVIVGKRRAQLGTTVAWTVSSGPNGQQRSDGKPLLERLRDHSGVG
jgi:hypothetical protein